MVLALLAILSLIGLMIFYLAVNWLFFPKKIMAQHDIQASSNTGTNYLRGDIGGILLAGTIFIFLFVVFGGRIWLYAGIILLASVIFGRLMSLIMDGYSRRGIQAIIVELVIIAIMVAVHYLD